MLGTQTLQWTLSGTLVTQGRELTPPCTVTTSSSSTRFLSNNTRFNNYCYWLTFLNTQHCSGWVDLLQKCFLSLMETWRSYTKSTMILFSWVKVHETLILVLWSNISRMDSNKPSFDKEHSAPHWRSWTFQWKCFRRNWSHSVVWLSCQWEKHVCRQQEWNRRRNFLPTICKEIQKLI